MEVDDKLAQWAALFLDAQKDCPAPAAAPAATQYSGITEAACALLQDIDAGGVPAFISANLRQIAIDNGISLSDESTPNQIVEALRRMAEAHPPPGANSP